jgi:putative transcription factor
VITVNSYHDETNVDWETVTKIGYRVNSGRPTTVKSKSEINAAARSGGVQAEKKFTPGINTRAAQSTEGQHLTKIDRENEVAPPPKVDMAVGKAISAARAAKTPPMKQAELAQKINEKPSVINGSYLEDYADDRL